MPFLDLAPSTWPSAQAWPRPYAVRSGPGYALRETTWRQYHIEWVRLY